MAGVQGGGEGASVIGRAHPQPELPGTVRISPHSVCHIDFMDFIYRKMICIYAVIYSMYSCSFEGCDLELNALLSSHSSEDTYKLMKSVK